MNNKPAVKPVQHPKTITKSSPKLKAKGRGKGKAMAKDKAKTKVHHFAEVNARMGAAHVDKTADDNDSDSGEEELRDKDKAHHFRKFMKSGDLPGTVAEIWNSLDKASGNKRKAQTKLVNDVIYQDDNGKWKFKKTSAVIERLAKKYKITEKEDAVHGVPKWMAMIWFNWNEVEFKKALREGELVEKEKDGRLFYTYITTKETCKEGTSTETTIQMSLKICDTVYETLTDVIENSHFQLKFTKQQKIEFEQAGVNGELSEDTKQALAEAAGICGQVEKEVLMKRDRIQRQGLEIKGENMYLG